jgi:hypothetical protein
MQLKFVVDMTLLNNMAALIIIALSCVFVFEDVNQARLFGLYYLFFVFVPQRPPPPPRGPAPRLCRGFEITLRHSAFGNTVLNE